MHAFDGQNAVRDTNLDKVFVTDVILDGFDQLWVSSQVGRIAKHVTVSINFELVAEVSAIDKEKLVNFVPYTPSLAIVRSGSVIFDVVCMEWIELKRKNRA